MNIVTFEDVLEYCNVTPSDTTYAENELNYKHKYQGSIINGLDVYFVNQRTVYVKDGYIYLKDGVIKSVNKVELSLDSILNYHNFDTIPEGNSFYVCVNYEDLYVNKKTFKPKIQFVDPSNYDPTILLFLSAIYLKFNFITSVVPQVITTDSIIKRVKTCELLNEIISSSGGTAPQINYLNCFTKDFVNATNLTVNHNLNSDCINYNIVDDNGSQIFPDQFIIVDNNNVNFKFTQATTGKVILFSCYTQTI